MPVIARIAVESEAAMTELAGRFAPIIRAGDCIGLAGELGAGKTVFAKGLIAAAVSVPQSAIPSPTFTLVQQYPFACDGDEARAIWHVDLWRVEYADEIAELGLAEALSRHICVIEWPERMAEGFPPDGLSIHIVETSASAREVTFTAHADSGWAGRLAPLPGDALG